MDKEREKRFDEHSEESSISKIKLPGEGILKTEIVRLGAISLNLSKMEPASFKSLIKAPEYLSEDVNVSDSVTLKSDAIVFSETSKTSSRTASKITPPTTLKNCPSGTSKISPPATSKSSPKLLMDLTKSMFGVEELLESINIQTEEAEEMLDMVSRAKEKLEFFISHVECLLKSLNENSEYSTTNKTGGNTYVKNMYRKKLEEFASRLLDKVKKSINYLEVEYETLKEQENKIAETCEKIAECNRISDNAENDKDTLLNETVDQLLEEIGALKSKQLSEIEKVSYIETDIDMLYDLYRRFSSIEGPNALNAFNFM